MAEEFVILVDENDNPIKGFSLDECIYINGDFVDTEVEYIKNLSEIEQISRTKKTIQQLLTMLLQAVTYPSLKGKQ